ncbi:MAG: hypothetical protein RR248_05720 [Clostridia bacterium]
MNSIILFVSICGSVLALFLVYLIIQLKIYYNNADRIRITRKAKIFLNKEEKYVFYEINQKTASK